MQLFIFLFLLVVLIENIYASRLEILGCVIEPRTTVELSSSMRGILEVVNVKRGDLVKKDQVLARLESSVEEVNVELAKMRAEQAMDIEVKKAQFDLHRRSKKRVAELYSKKMASSAEHDEATTTDAISRFQYLEVKEEKKILAVELKRAQSILRLRTIFSPVNGVVVEKFKSAGEFVDEEAVLKIAEINPLKVEVVIPVSLFGTISEGMEFEVLPELSMDKKLFARVIIVDKVIDASSGTFGIILDLPNEDNAIPSGLKCELETL